MLCIVRKSPDCFLNQISVFRCGAAFNFFCHLATPHWAALREKGPFCPESLQWCCHTKRRIGAHGRVRPSFGMTPNVPYTERKKWSRNGSRVEPFQNSSRVEPFWLHFFFSVQYQVKGERGHTHPSFFWYDNDSGH